MSRMREIRSYGSTRGLQVKVACDPVRSSRVRRNVLDHRSFFHLRSTLPVKALFCGVLLDVGGIDLITISVFSYSLLFSIYPRHPDCLSLFHLGMSAGINI